jgi:predicted RNA-binding protein with PIN domain
MVSGTMEAIISFVIIDGYNLIGTAHKNLEGARESLIQRLIAYRAVRAHDIVVVFDGHKEGPGPQSHMIRAGVEIIYSGRGESADSVIKRIIDSVNKDGIVISSDREIMGYAWSHDVAAVESWRFSRILDRIVTSQDVHDYENRPAPENDNEEDENTPSSIQKRGNPFRLSKKDRALQRALGKL